MKKKALIFNPYFKTLGGGEFFTLCIVKFLLENNFQIEIAWTEKEIFKAIKERFDFLLKLAEDFKVDGVVWYPLMYRETYAIEGYLFQKALEKLRIPMLKIASTYDASETNTFRARIEAFIEIIKGGGNHVS